MPPIKTAFIKFNGLLTFFLDLFYIWHVFLFIYFLPCVRCHVDHLDHSQSIWTIPLTLHLFDLHIGQTFQTNSKRNMPLLLMGYDHRKRKPCISYIMICCYLPVFPSLYESFWKGFESALTVPAYSGRFIQD